jgi:hypothetical protein
VKESSLIFWVGGSQGDDRVCHHGVGLRLHAEATLHKPGLCLVEKPLGLSLGLGGHTSALLSAVYVNVANVVPRFVACPAGP